jgi:hypothetical protein
MHFFFKYMFKFTTPIKPNYFRSAKPHFIKCSLAVCYYEQCSSSGIYFASYYPIAGYIIHGNCTAFTLNGPIISRSTCCFHGIASSACFSGKLPYLGHTFYTFDIGDTYAHVIDYMIF